MKNSAFENFSEKAQEALDFARCQREDGTFYGTSGRCVSGTGVGDKEKTPTRTRPRAAIESDMKKLSSSGAMAAKGTAGVRAREKHAALKAELKKPLAGAKKKEAKGASTSASSGGAPTSKEVRALDKAAKAADKKAEAADKKWRKGGMKDKALQKEVRRLDKEAKAANKAAEKADKAFQKGAKSKPAADPDKAAKSEARAAKQLKSAKAALQREAKGLKEMRDRGITDNRIAQATARVRSEKAKLEKLRNAAAKKSGTARPEKSTMTSRVAKEERDIIRKAGAGNAKAKQYTDLKKRIQDGKVDDPISARRQLSSLRAELKPASPNQ